MRRVFKAIGWFLLALLVFTVSFFLWASSSVYPEKDYASLKKYKESGFSAEDSVITVISYNIGYLSGLTNNKAVESPESLYETNLDRTKSVFGRIQPDIIAFQEIDFRSARSYEVDQQEALSELGFSYGAEVVNWDKRYVPFPYYPFSRHFGKMLSGQSVLSNFEIKEQERIVLARVEGNPFWRDAFYLDRLAQVLSLEINGKELKMINVHLEAFDKATRDIQIKKIIELVSGIKDKYPLILLGDFNSDPNNKDASILALLEMEGIKSAEDSFLQKTFPSDAPRTKIDYIFYNPAFIEKIDAGVVTEVQTASDHLPVFMDFVLKDTE
ncbi:endonuclease/exonuclease/phosphatase [Leptobacterium flavescens]|uniref:Endonuclease/exonuclease/phosphatase n=1 Tax=Leptobacterium flavescens TaxID=472055 RepID=A0A6P0UNR6_9FLAO|nr:endonuclease/exonuclease/phosphatase family protein [Leptobacterium flavescens]NER14954.1 endonuclease/exonuclease/phosphatase [Leptobacterium flavescens]